MFLFRVIFCHLLDFFFSCAEAICVFVREPAKADLEVALMKKKPSNLKTKNHMVIDLEYLEISNIFQTNHQLVINLDKFLMLFPN